MLVLVELNRRAGHPAGVGALVCVGEKPHVGVVSE